MKIVLPGGSGQVGRMLCRAWSAAGHEVVVLGRSSSTASLPARYRPWDPSRIGEWAEELEGADVVVHLSGRSVDCRYTMANRRAILESRVQSTRTLGAAIGACTRPPRLWLQAGTATIYSHRFDGENDEASGLIGGEEPGVPSTWRFSIEVAKAWEAAVDRLPLPSTRKVILRSAMIMSPDRGGVFDTLLGLIRKGLGGRSGNGRQFVSWINERDFVRSLDWLIEREDIRGAVNLAAPGPLPNSDFMRALRRAWGMPFGLPATRWMLEVGAFFLRTETELILKSRRVVPGRLLDGGFRFEFPDWPTAARDLCAQWRAPGT